MQNWRNEHPSKSLGWSPTCDHFRDPCATCGKAWKEVGEIEKSRLPSCSCGIVPCVVLDPFGGSGTVGQVARSLGRYAILIEAKEEYVEMIRERLGALGKTPVLGEFS